MRKLEKPIDAGHGQMIVEAVREVAWRGGELLDNLYDTFGLIMKLPDHAEGPLYFPVIQECKDKLHRWIEIPRGDQKRDELAEPAPFIVLTRETP
jgi:uncharacterized protein YcnI